MRWQTSDRRACAGLCFRQGHVKVKFGDTASRQVQASKEEAAVFFFFLRIVEATAPVHLVEHEVSDVLAAADAFAGGDVAGLGGAVLVTSHLRVGPGQHQVFRSAGAPL